MSIFKKILKGAKWITKPFVDGIVYAGKNPEEIARIKKEQEKKDDNNKGTSSSVS